jgi:hypothetical protein
MQRRSSFQAATKLNSFDFSTTQDSFYFLDKQAIKPSQRNHYSPEHYREKRREYSSYAKSDSNHRQNSLVMENPLLTNGYSNKTNDQQWREMNIINEMNRENYISNDNERDDGIFV